MDSRLSTTRRTRLVYGAVFLVLAVITVVEVWLSSSGVGLSRQVLTPIFFVFSLGKAGLVAAFYMHLRSDARFYTFIFLLPVILLLLFAYLMIVT
ncbi:MAG: hypothetical protein GTO14_18095 [Anaerolineales bacterium]|nr:hypothetical protein [Anaerolineales bacterium]